LNALDDATFAELAAGEERLHQALQDPATIRSRQALSIAKTNPRRKIVARQQILDDIFSWEDKFDIDPPWSGTGMTSRQRKVRSSLLRQ